MKLALKIWWFTLAVKLALSLILPFSADEAYYWVWSLKPQLSYYDHPPMVAWLFSIGNWLQIISPQLVKWPAIILGHSSLLIWYFIIHLILLNAAGERITNKDEQNFLKTFIWLWLFSPFLGVGSLIQTPDIPLVFFWSLSLLFALKLLREASNFHAICLGLSLGTGFLSKYHVVLFVPAMILWISFERLWSKVKIKHICLAIISGLIACSPVLIWNYQNDFVSFRFQLQHGFSRPDYNFYWTWSYLLSQILLLFPTVLVSIFRSRLTGLQRSLIYFGWTPILFFFISSFSALVEANWTISAYPALIAIAALSGFSRLNLKIYSLFWASLALGMSILVSVNFDSSAVRKFSELKQIKQMSVELKKYEPLYFDTYQNASLYSWLRRKLYCKLPKSSRLDYYDFLSECQPKESVIFYFANNETNPPDWIQTDSHFQSRVVTEFSEGYRIFRIEKLP